MKRLMSNRVFAAGVALGVLALAAGAYVPARAGELIDTQFADANAPGVYDGKSFAKVESSAQQIGWTFTNSAGHFAVTLANRENTCGGNTWWGVDATTAAGKVFMSQLLAAKGMGKRVIINCSGIWNGWNNILYVYAID